MKREPLSIDPPDALLLPWWSRLDRFDYMTIAIGIAAPRVACKPAGNLSAVRLVPKR
jgi:hypothetical protein